MEVVISAFSQHSQLIIGLKSKVFIRNYSLDSISRIYSYTS